MAKIGGSYKKIYSQAKTIQHALFCLKEDFGPHKLVSKFLEEIGKTKSYYIAIMPMLSKIRSHLRRHDDTYLNVFQHENDDLTLRSIINITKEHRTQDKFIIDS